MLTKNRQIETSNMRNKLFYLGILFLTLFTLVSFSDKPQSPDFITKVHTRFHSFLEIFGEEKLYLQTDKPYYSAGENIWFKGYLVNAATLRPESLSGFIYVELINPVDSVVSRVKIPKDSGGFAGYICLDQTITEGDYNLRAYSQWMQNNSADFFFSKNIYIGNKIEDAINLEATYGNVIDGAVRVNVKFTNENKIPFSNIDVLVSGLLDGNNRRKTPIPTNTDGEISFNLSVDTINQMPKVLDLSLYVGDSVYQSQLFIPDFSNDFDVQFFPESGPFLNEGIQYIAFKAIGTNGMSRKVSGKIYSGKGEELSDIKTQFNGMGKFLLNAAPDENYYVILKSERGIEKRFDLPKLDNEGISLQLNFYRGNINYRINNQLSDPSLPLYLLI